MTNNTRETHISVANLVVGVDVDEGPLVVGHAHARVLGLELEHLLLVGHGQVGEHLGGRLLGRLEAQELIEAARLRVLRERERERLTVALLAHHEQAREKVLAAYEHRTPGRAQRLLLHRHDQRIVDLYIRHS